MAGPNMEQFELYFRRADMDQDGRITGPEAVAFFQATNLPKQVLAQIWTHADQNRIGFLGRAEFYNALKLVTVAQSKRDLTQDIVKAALYGPASAKIPAPQINLAVLPTPQPNMRAGTPSQQFTGTAPMTYQNTGTRGSQGFSPQQNQVMRPPRPPPPGNAFHSQLGVASQPLPGGGTMAASPIPPSSNISTDLLGGGTGGSPAVVTSQVPSRGINASITQGGLGLATSGSMVSPRPTVQATTTSMQLSVSKPNDSSLTANQVGAKDFKASTNLGNGFASDPVFGDVFSATSVQVRQNSPVPASSTSGLPVSSAIVPTFSGPQTTVRPSPLGPMQSAPAQVPTGSQNQHLPSTMKVNQQVSVQSSNAFPAGGRSSASGQPNVQWPKMTQADVQKYSKVFVEVDTDRDGKITGEQTRNLFLSWRLPREILKQVWDLSDQDNDSMLSLREFCVALYLLERYRDGRPLPSVLPSNIIFEDAQFLASGQPAAAYGNASWRHNPGLQQTQGMLGPRPVAPAAGGKPPRPLPQPDEENVQHSQQKPRLPALEKHLVDQLSTEEQNSLNSKFKELTEADKKVTELEKEIMDSKEKIEFYRTKMQEIILYKSRCDSRLNEITERVSADKREAETLAKKYEEKYKQSGDVASKLTIEEATFRDIQEKKMELYRKIVKLEQEGGADKIQVHADRIQLDLEEQVKTLNERCKTYGLRAKPTSLVELPFGWQPGIQAGAADWNEEWDCFEDEGFMFVKELTLDVKNVIVPPKSKAPLVQKEPSQPDESVPEPSSNVNGKSENSRDGESNPEHENTHKEDEVAGSPLHSPSRKNAVDSPSNLHSPSKNFQDSPSKKGINLDGSPHAMEMQSEHWGAESVLSEDRRFDEPVWGSFDTHYDTDAGWNSNLDAAKDSDNERHSEASFFGPDSWGLNPIRTESKHTDNMFQKKNTYAFTDSVPGTPMSNYGTTPHTDNLFEKKSPFAFADSVPSTPVSSYGNSLYSDNMFQKNTFGFADSVPSTPIYNSVNSPRKSGDGSEDHSFDLSRFDSFNDGGLFPSSEFSRFDSMSSTRDSDNDHGLFAPRESFARFDSFRSTADSEYNPVFPAHDSFTRFDSMRSTRDNDYSQGFPSFDDTDPFGSSSEPFKISVGSETPRKETDSWKAF